MIKDEQLREEAMAAANYDDQSRKINQPSRSIFWSRDIASPLFEIVLQNICNEIEGKEERSKKRSIRAHYGFTRMVKALVLDLYVARKSNKRMQLGLPLNKNEYSPTNNYHRMVSFYQSVALSYVHVQSAYKGLEACGYLRTEKKGHFDKEKGKGKRTRIRATQKLMSALEEQAHITLWQIRQLEGCNNIILKDENKDIIPYEHNSQTTKMSENLERINRHLSTFWIDLYLKDTEFEALRRHVWNRHLEDEEALPSIDVSARTLRRIFNNSSWNEGGRFYGAWWLGIPKEYRKYIHINGKQTVELDYSGMHPALVYAEVGVTPPLDPYDMGLENVVRDVKKVAFNSLVNASNKNIKQHSDFNEMDAGCSWQELLEAIIDAHSPIREYFGSGFGLQLQKKDADIAEKVMLRFADMQYACLPVHDSFLVHHALADELREYMEHYYMEVAGAMAKVDGKSILTYDAPVEHKFVDMGNVEEMLSGGEYREYTNRQYQWYSYIDNMNIT